MFVADSNNHRIQVLNADRDLSYSHMLNCMRGDTDCPWGVACDHSGAVFVTNHNSDCVQKFSAIGEGQFFLYYDSRGRHLNKPKGICIDSTDKVYIAYDNRVSAFDSRGQLLRDYARDYDTDERESNSGGLAVDNTRGRLFVCGSNSVAVYSIN